MHRLLYGNARSPLSISCRPGHSMAWHVAHCLAEQQRSDIVNLSRAIEAAEANADADHPGENRKLLRWEIGCLEDGHRSRDGQFGTR